MLFAIGDLHMGHAVDKSMDIFGENWVNHIEKIKESWIENVTDQDVVLVLGDISWGMNLGEAMIDLEWMHHLPGKKICIKGNHDYWWQSITKLNNLFDDVVFLQNAYEVYEDYAICGTRGWNCPNSSEYTAHDEKMYAREVHRLKTSLDLAVKAGYSKFIVMLHYPPTNEHKESSDFTELVEAYGVEKVLYGHLHDENSFGIGLQGVKNGVEYALVSSDYLDFKLLKII